MITQKQIKFIHSLKLKKNRSDFFVVEGEKMVKELIQSDFKIEHLYKTNNFNVDHDLIEVISEKEMSRMSHFKNPSSVLALVKKQNKLSALNPNKLEIALDNIKDPGNLGTIIRIADWFGISTIFCSENTVDLYNPKTVQSSMGSIFRVNVITKNLKSEFESYDGEIIGAHLEGQNIYQSKLNKKGVLLIGSESHGISNDLMPYVTKKVKIPSFGNAESLNAAVACGIICSEIKRD